MTLGCAHSVFSVSHLLLPNKPYVGPVALASVAPRHLIPPSAPASHSHRAPEHDSQLTATPLRDCHSHASRTVAHSHGHLVPVALIYYYYFCFDLFVLLL